MYDPLRLGWPSHWFLVSIASRMNASQYSAQPISCTATPAATTAATTARRRSVVARSMHHAAGTSTTGTAHTKNRGPHAQSPLHERYVAYVTKTGTTIASSARPRRGTARNAAGAPTSASTSGGEYRNALLFGDSSIPH